MSLNSSALAAKACSRRSSAGSSVLVASSSAARCTAVWNTSLEDWPMFTWSLGCAGGWDPLAIVAMTSLAFMFDEVPEPVWKTSIGNWPSCLPSAISSPASAIRFARSPSSRPSSAFARAAAPFTRPSQRTTAAGTRSPETGKLSTALRVSPPHSSWGASCTLIRPPFRVAPLNASAAAGTPTARAWRCARRARDPPAPPTGHRQPAVSGRACSAAGGDRGHVVRVQRLVAVPADQHGVGHRPARVVQLDGRRGVVEVLVAPAHDRDDRGIERPTGLREPVLEALGLLLVAAPLEDPRADQRLQPRGQDVARDPEVALHVGEAADAVERLAQDEEGPALAEDVHRAPDGAAVRPGELVHLPRP